MKVKVIWEEGDIKGGCRVRTRGCNEAWMVAYRVGNPGDKSVYALVSTKDGMFAREHLTVKQMADYLNELESVPENMLVELKGG